MKKYMMMLAGAALMLAACQESLEERCQREAREFTEKQCPARMDKFTFLDSMTFDVPTHTITYSYTLSGQLDDSIVNSIKARELLLQQLKNSTNLKRYKKAGYRFRHTYYSSKQKGVRLFDTTFQPEDYQ